MPLSHDFDTPRLGGKAAEPARIFIVKPTKPVNGISIHIVLRV